MRAGEKRMPTKSPRPRSSVPGVSVRRPVCVCMCVVVCLAVRKGGYAKGPREDCNSDGTIHRQHSLVRFAVSCVSSFLLPRLLIHSLPLLLSLSLYLSLYFLLPRTLSSSRSCYVRVSVGLHRRLSLRSSKEAV
ncbi:unnamed protein product [Protopolystoma xenopodis]|uniref:Uncharacterized protein n=1 Tax=Protopolystoma xenopodis TaxID=117903 RepID=A0A448XQ55_9PLAT|nr:unnamed protein product [Protopolystoma xenopodis]